MAIGKHLEVLVALVHVAQVKVEQGYLLVNFDLLCIVVRAPSEDQTDFATLQRVFILVRLFVQLRESQVGRQSFGPVVHH